MIIDAYRESFQTEYSFLYNINKVFYYVDAQHPFSNLNIYCGLS